MLAIVSLAVMSQAETLSVMNRLLAILYRSLPLYLDDAQPWRFGEQRPEQRRRTHRCRVPFEVPKRGIERLPDSVQVGFAVRRARRAVGRRLCSSRRGEERDKGRHRDPGKE